MKMEMHWEISERIPNLLIFMSVLITTIPNELRAENIILKKSNTAKVDEGKLTARVIIRKAVKVYGGVENMRKRLSNTYYELKRIDKGKVSVRKLYWLAPDKMAINDESEQETTKSVYNKGECHSTKKNVKGYCDKKTRSQLKRQVYLSHIANLYPLLDEGITIRLDKINKKHKTAYINVQDRAVYLNEEDRSRIAEVMKITIIVDLRHFLLREVNTSFPNQEERMKRRTVFYAYKKFNRVLVPIKYSEYQGATMLSSTKVEKVSFGVVKESAFEIPVSSEK